MNEEMDTLGRRLDGEARRMAARSALVLPWAAPFGVLLDHLAELPSPDERFTRREVGGAEVSWPAQGRARPGGSAAPTGRPLPANTVTRLRSVVGPGVEAMRVHDDEVADETARAHGADAVTVGTDVYFRRGQYDPVQPRGFGLLVHEATHVVERLTPGAPARRATSSGVTAEENLALKRESSVLTGQQHGSPTPPAVGVPPAVLAAPSDAWPAAPAVVPPATPMVAPSATPVSVPVSTPAARPMTATVDRPTGALPAAPPPAGVDVDALRSRIMRDLMRQLRDEFERGA